MSTITESTYRPEELKLVGTSSVPSNLEQLAHPAPVGWRTKAPSIRLAVLFWVIGLPLLALAPQTPVVVLVGLGLLTMGAAVIGISAREAEQRWVRGEPETTCRPQGRRHVGRSGRSSRPGRGR